LNNNVHIPVLLHQVLAFLKPTSGDVVLDCTLGAGGHAKEIAKLIGPNGHLYGIDADERNLSIAKENLKDISNITFIHDNFENLEEIGERVLKERGAVHGILMDLGLSSLHIDQPERGFSHRFEGPLDMRFDPRQNLTAADIVNTYSIKDLQELFSTYSQERYAHRIAKRIADDRPFTTTSELKSSIEASVPLAPRRRWRIPGRKGVHPSVTRVFQALRIATNREIEVLGHGLHGAVNVLSPGGRIVVISYHSVEDRIVKNVFRDAKKEGQLELLTKKPLEADTEETATNVRARSAKLRAARKV